MMGTSVILVGGGLTIAGGNPPPLLSKLHQFFCVAKVQKYPSSIKFLVHSGKQDDGHKREPGG